MARKFFDYPAAALKDTRPNVSKFEAADRLYERMGKRFPMEWTTDNEGNPVAIVDEDLLPNDVSATDVENELANMKAEGVF